MNFNYVGLHVLFHITLSMMYIARYILSKWGVTSFGQKLHSIPQIYILGAFDVFEPLFQYAIHLAEPNPIHLFTKYTSIVEDG